MLATVLLAGILPIADQEGGCPLRGVSVIVSEHMRVGLQKETDIGVPDPVAEHLRAYVGLERRRGVGVP